VLLFLTTITIRVGTRARSSITEDSPITANETSRPHIPGHSSDR